MQEHHQFRLESPDNYPSNAGLWELMIFIDKLKMKICYKFIMNRAINQ